VQIISDIAIESRLEEAKEMMQKIDPDDAPFIAAALAVDNEGIWTDDAHF
jgi:predicted nucleic acid-binding protein